MCNSNKYRRKKHPNGEKKNREHLAQLTKSEIRYRSGINNPVTSFKEMAKQIFLSSFHGTDNETSWDLFIFLPMVFARSRALIG